jgi:hypothetical protein
VARRLAAKKSPPPHRYTVMMWVAGLVVTICIGLFGLFVKVSQTGISATNTAIATGNGNCAVSGTGNQVNCATTGTIVTRPAFKSIQAIDNLGTNDTLHLDDLATLTLFAPYSLMSVTLIFDVTAIHLPNTQIGPYLFKDRHFLPHDPHDEYLFDIDVNKRREFAVKGRTFIVTLLHTKKLDTPNYANPIEWEFGISEQ